MHYRGLRTRFVAYFILATATALGSSTVSACGSTTTADGNGTGDAATDAADAAPPVRIDRSGFVESCGSGLDAFTIVPQVDSIELRSFRPDRSDGGSLDAGSTDAGPGLREGIEVLQKRGTPCSTATDKADCENRYRRAATEVTSWPPSVPIKAGAPSTQLVVYLYYVYTRGDTVGIVADTAALKALIAPIDTPMEALHVLRGPSAIGGGCLPIRADGDGFALLTTVCGPDPFKPTIFEVVTKVSPDGTVREVQRVGPFEDQTKACGIAAAPPG